MFCSGEPEGWPNSNEDRQALVRRLANEDRQAFARLFLQHSDRENFGHHYFRANVFYGRREEITAAAKFAMREYTQRREVQIMSYDRLMEASVRSGYDDVE